ncbi:MAG TPA: dihydrofolate reductase family protein [Streptosporangiaceae bacterium]|nr:dihydrofolate reductase family protein [Streptosporangiaceae bacterium]
MSTRKIIAALFVSVDGVVTADHTPYIDAEVGEWMAAQTAERDTLLLGRRTYQQMAAYWPTAGDSPITAQMNDTPKLVVSTTLQSADEWQNSTLVKGDPVAELNRTKHQPGKNIMLIGSATLARSLLRDGAVDELVLLVYPAVAGDGTRLFEDGHDRIPLELAGTQVFGNGLVKLTYTPAGR